MFPRVIQFLSGRTLARPAAGSISALLQCTILATIAVSMFAGVNISVGESVQGNVVAQVEMGGGEVWAAEGDPEQGKIAEKVSGWLLYFANTVYEILFMLLTPFLMLVGWLLTPDWVFGEVFGLRPILHSLWVLVSNVVYVIFAFLLVVMAFMNIFAGEKNTWAIKAKLPKLIVGVISVPFTWFFVSAIASISSVLTASAIQLAGDLQPTNAPQLSLKLPSECTLDFNATPTTLTTATGWDKKIAKKGEFLDCKESEEKSLSELLKSDNAYGIVSYYVYGVFQIQELKSITGINLSTLASTSKLGVNIIVAVIMFFVMCLIIIALGVSLLMRAVYFWAIAIFSPLLSLRYFFDGKLGFGDDWLSITKIIGLAMVPVYVAAALALGLVFISATKSLQPDSNKSNYVQVDPSSTKDKQIITLFGTKYTILGTPVGANYIGDSKTIAGGFIGNLLIQVAALCILWFAVMAALKGSKITQEAAEPISKFGGEIGGLLKKLPQYAPIIPTGHGKASIASMWNIASTVKGRIDSQYWADRGNTIGQSMMNRAWIGGEGSKKREAADNFYRTKPNGTIIDDQRDEFIQEFAQKTQFTYTDMSVAENRGKVKGMLDKFSGIKPTDKESLVKLADKMDGTQSTFNEFMKEVLKLSNQSGVATPEGAGTFYENARKNSQTAAGTSAAANGAAPTATPKLTLAIDARTTKNLDIQVTAWEMSNFAAKTADFTAIKTDLAWKTPAEKQALTATVKAQLSAAWIDKDSEVKKILTALGLPTT